MLARYAILRHQVNHPEEMTIYFSCIYSHVIKEALKNKTKNTLASVVKKSQLS